MSSPEGENKCMHGVHVHVCAGCRVQGRGGGGGGFPQATMNVAPGYFHWKVKEK